MRLIQCRRGPTSPSGSVLSEAPSGAPNSRNTSSTLSRGMLPTSSASVPKASSKIFIARSFMSRGQGRRNCSAGLEAERAEQLSISGLSVLAHRLHAAADQAGEPRRERLGVGGPVTVEHARFIVEEVGGVLLEGG